MLLGSSHRIHGTDWYICRRLVDVFMENVGNQKTTKFAVLPRRNMNRRPTTAVPWIFFQRPLTLLMVAFVKDKNIILSQHDPRIHPPGNQHGPRKLAIPKRNTSSNPWFSGDMSVSRSLGLGMIVRDVNRKPKSLEMEFCQTSCWIFCFLFYSFWETLIFWFHSLPQALQST